MAGNLIGVFAALAVLALGPHTQAEGIPERPKAQDYFEPSRLTATILSPDGPTNEVMFRFRRTAVRDGTAVRVLREYTRPDGTLVARERVLYQSGKLVSFQLEEPLSGAQGSLKILPDTEHEGRGSLKFEYTSESGSRKESSEALRPDTLVNDMVGPFIADHWELLMRGASLKTRFAAIARAETVGFKFTKESETTWRNRPAVVIKMEPTSWIISKIVKALLFTVEKDPPHRVLEYMGRTPPRLPKGKHWEDLDAVTVFEWQ